MKITHRVFLRAMASMTLTRALLLVPLVAALVAGSANPARTGILLTDGTTLIASRCCPSSRRRIRESAARAAALAPRAPRMLQAEA